MSPVALAAVDPGLTGPAWPPLLVGALLGALSTMTLLVANRMLGASSAYASVAGAIGARLFPRHTRSLRYYRDHPPRLDWEVTLVAGAIAGGFLAAWTGGELTGRWLPPLWGERFGQAVWLRFLVAFAGGALMGFGARLAGGCTSGHGISGALQLGVDSWIALLCFFLGGAAVAFPLYGT
jgi:uncharacterized membrane protein YedE/YeeE